MIAQPPTILLVDDAATMRALMRALLGSEYAYLEAEDGGAAFELARHHRPDFILMDIQMPGVDGVQGLRLLKHEAATAAIPVVIVTTEGTPERRAQCQALGCADFLTKPVARGVIQAVVRRCLRR